MGAKLSDGKRIVKISLYLLKKRPKVSRPMSRFLRHSVSKAGDYSKHIKRHNIKLFPKSIIKLHFQLLCRTSQKIKCKIYPIMIRVHSNGM